MKLVKSLIKTDEYRNVTKENIMYSDVIFDQENGMDDSVFLNCVFILVQFDMQSLTNTRFIDCIFENVYFHECDLENAEFKNCKYQNFKIHDGKNERITF